MATAPQFRTLLVSVLQKPSDRARGYALADWLDEQKYPRAAIIRQSFREGVVIFDNHGSGSTSGRTAPVVEIVIQLLPQSVAIEFACRCVELVMEHLTEIYPITDPRPGTLLQTIRAWATGRASKRQVSDAADAFGELVRRSSLTPDDSDPEDEEERDAVGRASCASDALSWLAAAVERSPSSPDWWHEIFGCLTEVHYSADDKKLPVWQRQQLIQVIQERDLGL